MGWTTALTAVANTPLTAGQWNGSIRDNLLETTPGIATDARTVFVTAGTNKIAARLIKDHIVDNAEETATASYGDLATVGPTVTLETGFSALVWHKCLCASSTNGNARMSYAVSGNTTIAAADNKARESDGGAGSWSPCSSVTNLETALNPGDNTFTAKYGIFVTAGTATFTNRRIVVMGL
jgi:hypothetical protein